eukprot:CAMPEP_0206260546 /NCGR_PEP_ID=MMETSP0047_2-20121206/27154_1 /ASSEMBLY_ACC=CAM_ASM_000192 /TAXON_ID=195065 /ORGANISM="Chroomonas mesostigmatica_cf, Strain CCMP1168" /LENGTH=259 /DNA_ID=CAMNT_0053687651 /DNA_START=53 /DNA_END=828 /DNA_ORIENTATION=-
MPQESAHGGEVGANILALRERLSKFDTEEGRMRGIGLAAQPTDLFITTTPKAGTTWMQQIVHQLRTGGSMEFEEISMEIPFLELAHDLGQDVTQPHKHFPRTFKTHLWRPHCPKGGRYIVVLRDPCDVALSFFRFFEGWFFKPGEVSLEEFVRCFWLARGEPQSELQNASAFHHLLSWWPHRWDGNVLVVFYEDMKADLRACVDQVANFLALPNDSPETRALAVEHSTLEFMSANKAHFDERLSRIHRNGPCGLPPDAG